MAMSTTVLPFPAKNKVKRPHRARTVLASGGKERVVAELLVFYGSRSRLANALGTTRDTVRSWSAGTAPAPPRVELLERAELLLGLCRAARRYMAADRQVGEWSARAEPVLAWALAGADAGSSWTRGSAGPVGSAGDDRSTTSRRACRDAVGRAASRLARCRCGPQGTKRIERIAAASRSRS